MLLLVCALVGGCSTTLIPMTSRDSATSLKTGERQIDIAFGDGGSFGFAYGLNDRTDIGADVQEINTVWLRHTVRQADPGVSLALVGGLFAGTVYSTPIGNLAVNGGYFGGIAEYVTSEQLSLSIAYRYNHVNYDSFTISPGGLFVRLGSLYFDVYDDEWTVSRSDFRGVGLLTLQSTFEVRSHLRVHVGMNCQYNHTENNARIRSDHCGPSLGLSFNHR